MSLDSELKFIDPQRRNRIAQYIKVSTPKYRKTKKAEFAKMISTSYSIPKSSGKLFSVCSIMFMEVTGLPKRRIQSIYRKLFKQFILLNGDDEKISMKSKITPEFKEKIQESLNAKKEKMFALKKGSYKTFVKAIAKNADETDESEDLYVEIPGPVELKPKQITESENWVIKDQENPDEEVQEFYNNDQEMTGAES